jgi:hypothetical protein
VRKGVAVKIYMVKKNGKYLGRYKCYRRGNWVDDPQKARVWTAYQGPAAAISQHGGEKVTLEIDIEKAKIPQPE